MWNLLRNLCVFLFNCLVKFLYICILFVCFFFAAVMANKGEYYPMPKDLWFGIEVWFEICPSLLACCACTAKGFDVVHIKVKARHILWPPLAQSVVSRIINFITTPPRNSQPVLVHGFSVGGYLYGETLNHIMSDPGLCESMSCRVLGQVFDSPVDFEGVPRGVGMALSNVRPVQLAIKFSLDAYTTLFHRQVTRYISFFLSLSLSV